MTIEEAKERIQSKKVQISTADSNKENLEKINLAIDTADGELDKVCMISEKHEKTELPIGLCNAVKSLKSGDLSSAESVRDEALNWVNEWNDRQRENKNAEPNQTDKENPKWYQMWWFDVIVGVVISAVGLVLGCTVFSSDKDTAYYICESIKDIIGGVTGGVAAGAVFTTERKKIFTTLGWIFFGVSGSALFFMPLINYFAIFERFITGWNKANHVWLWIWLIVIGIAGIICILSNSASKSKETEKGGTSAQ